jgi:hypothetical protein
LETFQSELGISFENQLEANHVIANKQVWVGSIGAGPTNVNLTGTAKNLETLVFQDEIGRIVIDVCKVRQPNVTQATNLRSAFKLEKHSRPCLMVSSAFCRRTRS